MTGSMLVAPDGALLRADHYARVRRIAPDGSVTTLAGGSSRGYADGPGSDAQFDGASLSMIEDLNTHLLARTVSRHRESQTFAVGRDSGKFAFDEGVIGVNVNRIEKERIVKRHLSEVAYDKGYHVIQLSEFRLNFDIAFAGCSLDLLQPGQERSNADILVFVAPP